MQTAARHLLNGINAGLFALILIYLMYQMVKTEDPGLAVAQQITLPPIVSTVEEPELDVLTVKPPKPKEPELAPLIERDLVRTIPSELVKTDWQDPVIDDNKAGFNFGGDQLVLVLGYPPVYPERLTNRGIEGFTVVGYSVDESGAVFNARILESQPEGAFDRASLKAISKFKYKPRVQGGKAVPVHNLRYKFSFKLDN